jgi:hypothetical protein
MIKPKTLICTIYANKTYIFVALAKLAMCSLLSFSILYFHGKDIKFILLWAQKILICYQKYSDSVITLFCLLFHYSVCVPACVSVCDQIKELYIFALVA